MNQPLPQGPIVVFTSDQDPYNWQSRPIPHRGLAVPSAWTQKALVLWAREIPNPRGRRLAQSALEQMGRVGAQALGTFCELDTEMRSFAVDPVTAFDLYIRAEEAALEGQEVPWTVAGRIVGLDTRIAARVFQSVEAAVDRKLLSVLRDDVQSPISRLVESLRALAGFRR